MFATENQVYDLWGNKASSAEKITFDLSQAKMVSKGILEFDNSYGRMSSVAELSDGKYVVAYEGPSNDGFIMTFAVANDGTVTQIVKLEHDTNQGQYNSLVKVYDDIYALAYTSSGRGQIKTFKIPNDGSSIKEISSRQHDTSRGYYSSLRRVDVNTFVLAYRGWGERGFLTTFDIDRIGLITELKDVKFDDRYANYSSLVELSPNYFAVAYNHAGRDINNNNVQWSSLIKTYKISDDGLTITGLKDYEFGAANGNQEYENSFIKIDEDSYALAYRDYNSLTSGRHRGILKTFTIKADGSSIVEESSQAIFPELTGNDGYWNSIIKMDSENILVKSRHASNYWVLKTYKISNNGKTLTNDWKFDVTGGADHDVEGSLFQLKGNQFGMAYAGPGSDGFIQIFDTETEDSQKPIIFSSQIARDNASVILNIDEQVFNTNSGKGFLENTDFDLAISGGTATLTSVNPSSITRIKDSFSYLLNIGFNGVADGNEILTITPANGGVFDAKGNAMDVNQSNNTFTLTEKTPPAITATTISTDNQTIKLTMSEAIFANSNGSGDIQKEDFTLSISCLLYTSPSPRDRQKSRMPSSA